MESDHDCQKAETIYHYPVDLGKMCTWVRFIVSQIAEIFRHGGNFPCLSRNGLNPDEFVFTCPDNGKVKYRIRRVPLGEPILDPFE